MSKKPRPFRRLTEEESAVIDALLSIDFPGRDQARRQVETCLVRPWDECEQHCGSLELLVGEDTPLIPSSVHTFDTPLPVEGRFMDSDGIPVDILLFQRDGKLNHLEFVVYGEKRRRKPKSHEIDVIRRQR